MQYEDVERSHIVKKMLEIYEAGKHTSRNAGVSNSPAPPSLKAGNRRFP